MAVRLWVHASQDRADVHADVAAREYRIHGCRTHAFRSRGGSAGTQGTVGVVGQCWLAHRQTLGGARQRGVAPPTSLHSGIATGRATVAAPARVSRQLLHWADGSTASHSADKVEIAGRESRPRPSG